MKWIHSPVKADTTTGWLLTARSLEWLRLVEMFHSGLGTVSE